MPELGGLDAVNTGAASAGLIVTVIEAVLTVPLALVAEIVKVDEPEALGSR